MNLTSIESKVLNEERLYPSSLVEVPKSQKNWLKKKLGAERNLGSPKILGPKQLWVCNMILGPKQTLGLNFFFENFGS